MMLRRVVLVVVFGVLSVGLGACGSPAGEDKASTAGQEEGAACIAALSAYKDNAKALCTEAADLGNPNGWVGLGLLASEAGDLVLAKSWYQKSADLGYSGGMVGLASVAYKAADLASAKSWWQKAADLDDSDGMMGLGLLAQDADDLELAKSWYQKAADLGNQNAIDALAELNAS
jgi:TPR repeat protein